MRDLKAEFSRPGAHEFIGKCYLEPDMHLTLSERARLAAQMAGMVTGWRFRYVSLHDAVQLHAHSDIMLPRQKEIERLSKGVAYVGWCCQDSCHVSKTKKHEKVERHRDNLGMVRFPCRSAFRASVTIEDDRLVLGLIMRHHIKHEAYLKVDMEPEALDMIRAHICISTPATMVTKIQQRFPNISASQVHAAWTEMSKGIWKRHENQSESADVLLKELQEAGEADYFSDMALPEGVEAVAWGLPRIAKRIGRHVVEVAMDATCTCSCNQSEQMLTPAQLAQTKRT
jgi:hypothetical protein